MKPDDFPTFFFKKISASSFNLKDKNGEMQ